MTLVYEFAAFLLLLLPFGAELLDDRNDDPNKKSDVLFRAILILFVASLNLGMSVAGLISWHGYFQAAFLSLALHFLLFDYAIAYVLGRKDWFSYLGKTSLVDKFGPWKRMNAGTRFMIRLTVFIVALDLYL